MVALREAFATGFQDVWVAFLADLEATDAGLAARDWSTVDPWALIVFADAGARVAHGVRQFLPAEFGAPDPADRMMLYFVRLILAGARTGQADPFIAVRRASWYLEAGRLADLEIQRRIEQHVGAYAALLLVRAALVTRGVTAPRSERESERAVEVLRRATWGKLRGWGRAIARAEGTGPRDTNAVRQALNCQAFETSVARWGPLDPFDALARGLAGELDIVTRAIADDLIDAARSARRRERREVLSVEFRERASPDQATGDVHARAAPYAEARWRELVEKLARDPELCRLAEAYLAGGHTATQDEVARRLGVTARTVRNRLRQVRDLLAE